MTHLILASTSPYRAAALARLGLAFETVDPGVVERAYPAEDPPAQALRLAHEKASAAAADVARSTGGVVIIGSDQVGVCGNRILYKPGTAAAAVEQLCSLSGKTAEFHSAVAVHDTRRRTLHGDVVTTRLLFRDFSEGEAARYVELDAPLNCAGSFKVEAAGIALFSRIESDDPSALIGLPMIRLLDLLALCGIQPFRLD